MRKLFFILVISVAIAILYGADSRAASGDCGAESGFGLNDLNGCDPMRRQPTSEFGTPRRPGFGC